MELVPGSEETFEKALRAAQSSLHGETLWYRMVAGGAAPRYMRLRPRPSMSAILEEKRSQTLPAQVDGPDRENDRRDPEPAPDDELQPRARSPVMESKPVDLQVRGACPLDCPDTCGWIVTVKDGVPVDLRGDPDHPYTRGSLCNKVTDYLAYARSPDRLLHPMRRVGPKGRGEFTRISWDEALATIAARFGDAIARHGAESIWPFLGSGSMGLIQGVYGAGRRLWNVLGTSRHAMTICTIAGGFGTGYTLGDNRVGMDPETLRFSRLLVLWGTNTLSTNPHLWRSILEARRNGAYVVAIDPIRTRTAAQCDWHLAPMPGTDAALALGLLHVVLAEGREDSEFIERHTVGWDAFRERILEFPAARVAAITGLPGRVHRRAGPAAGRDAADRDPHRHRHPASWRRRHGGARRSPAFPASPATGGMRAAASATTRAASSAWTGPRSGATTCGRAHARAPA